MSEEYRLKMLNIGLEIYDMVLEAVKKIDPRDRQVYSHAYYKLGDGRTMRVELYCDDAEVHIDNEKWDDNYRKFVGDTFAIIPYRNGTHLVRAEIKKPINWPDGQCDPELLAGEEPHSMQERLSEEEQVELEQYLLNIKELVKDMKYDVEKVHRPSNLNGEYEHKRKVAIYNRLVSNLPQGETVIEPVKIGVDWWINEMSGHRKGGGIGADSESAAMAEMLMGMFYAKSEPLPEELENFRQILINKVTERLENGREATLDVDYWPTGMLADAMQEAHVSSHRVPSKTTMHIRVDEVSVSCGYCAPWETLYKKEYGIYEFIEEEPSEEQKPGDGPALLELK